MVTQKYTEKAQRLTEKTLESSVNLCMLRASLCNP
jgi:hypothetical protein